MVTARQLAERLGLISGDGKPSTWRRWVKQGILPKPTSSRRQHVPGCRRGVLRNQREKEKRSFPTGVAEAGRAVKRINDELRRAAADALTHAGALKVGELLVKGYATDRFADIPPNAKRQLTIDLRRLAQVHSTEVRS
jgi:hypothetical protein